MNPFLVELKRRRVVRVALVYGAVAFAVVQAADVFVPALALPGWILTAVALLAVLGFPVALVLAWAYDIVPEEGSDGAASDVGAGEADRTRHADGEEPPLPGRSDPAWLNARTLVVLVVLVAAGIAIGAGWLIPTGAATAERPAGGDAPPPSPSVTRMPLSIDGASLRAPPTLSRDGRQIAWATADGIHIRSLDRLEERIIAGTEGGAGWPFFSPDGRSLGFLVEGRLHIVLAGGWPFESAPRQRPRRCGGMG